MRVMRLLALAALAVPLGGLLASCDVGGEDTSALITANETAALSESVEVEAEQRRVTAPPAPPPDLGFVDSAPVPDPATVPPFVDFAYTNQRGDARYATLETNAGVRVLAGFLSVWRPTSLFVDAGQSAPAVDGFPAVVPSTWTGIPGDATDGTVLDAAVLAANVQYVVDVTSSRSAAQELAAYLDDRRGKAYSVSDGMGPLTEAWRTAAQQTTTIVDIPADATTVKYDDKGNNAGVGGSANPTFGAVVDLVDGIGENGSTEPAKRFYKYARPWRWSAAVSVVPALEPVKSPTPKTDGGFISGHTAEAVRNALAIGYMVPERLQEMLSRALELGENRILAGMHSPLDVIGGRLHAQAVAAASLSTGANASKRAAAHQQAQAVLMAAMGVTTQAELLAVAHSQPVSVDRFADHDANKAAFRRRLTYGFEPTGDVTRPAVVPKGAEVLLETRFPYLDAAQRRVVLKTTALPSGYPLLDDVEGWGRLNLFDAADGYGALNGDTTVTMNADAGGFSAHDSWRNDISGDGKLVKLGTGVLELTGHNTYTGGTQLMDGALVAGSERALGRGPVYVGGGSLAVHGELHVGGSYTQLSGTTLDLSLADEESHGLQVRGRVSIAGGTLHVQVPVLSRRHQLIPVIRGKSLRGRFATIAVDGYHVLPIYTATELLLLVWR